MISLGPGDDGRPGLDFPMVKGQRSLSTDGFSIGPLYRDDLWLNATDSGRAPRGVVVMHVDNQARSTLNQVFDGVVVKRTLFQVSATQPMVAFRVLMACAYSDLEEDLFTVRETLEPGRALQELEPRLREIRTTLEQKLGELLYINTSRAQRGLLALNVVLLLLPVLILGLLTKGAGGVMLGGVYLGFFFFSQKMLRSSLRRALDELYQGLGTPPGAK